MSERLTFVEVLDRFLRGRTIEVVAREAGIETEPIQFRGAEGAESTIRKLAAWGMHVDVAILAVPSADAPFYDGRDIFPGP